MKTPLMHPRTQAALMRYQKKPAHGLILSGKTGMGKTTVANWLATQHSSEPVIIEAESDAQGITIEQIRNLYNITRSGAELTLIIKNAHTMSREAQNAFLKLLEEPPANTQFILTVNRKQALLTTIQSRTQHIEILSPPLDQLITAAQEGSTIPVNELRALLQSVDALPGRFFRLLADPELLKLHREKTATAKQFYAGSRYERHGMAIAAKFEREWATQLLDTLAIIVQTLLQASKADGVRLKKLTQQANIIEAAAQNIALRNANVKIQLTQLIEYL